MNILYLDCSMGAAGDMLTAALLELLPNPEDVLQQLNSLGLPGVHFTRETSVKCGITGTHMSATIHGQEEESLDHSHQHHHDHCHAPDQEHSHGEHHHDHAPHHDHDTPHTHSHGSHTHTSLEDIRHIVLGLPNLPPQVKENAMAVYELLAQAEGHAHGMPVTQIHFHEVGTMDAIADIVAVCLLMDRLAPDQVVVSPIHVGSGQVRCAHGILPVPAPATAFLLTDVPIYGGEIAGELCTPTGAALLKHFATRFGSMPVMRPRAVGYGMGKKDFPAANCIRAMLGDAQEETDGVLELSCNVDDMTPEQIGFAMEHLLGQGALDVYTVPIGMKKSRPGTLICVLCRSEDRQKMVEQLFQHTTTLGIREARYQRYVLHRTFTTLDTPYGPVRRKDSSGYGVSRSKYEYEDLARIAGEQNLSLEVLLALLRKD